MSKVMVTVRADRSTSLSVDDLVQRFHISHSDLDEDFGVIEIDPKDHAFTFLVEESAAKKIVKQADAEVSGPFSNPVIEDFRVG